MNLNQLYIGNTKLFTNANKVEGNFVNIEGESFYKISDSNKMRPFFMSMVSDSNHWMFLSSNGGLTAGRKDCDTALFPYYTDDKITESVEITGSKTIFQIHKGGKFCCGNRFPTDMKGFMPSHEICIKIITATKLFFRK